MRPCCQPQLLLHARRPPGRPCRPETLAARRTQAEHPGAWRCGSYSGPTATPTPRMFSGWRGNCAPSCGRWTSTRSAPSPSTEWLATLSRSVVEPRATGVQPQGENMKQTYRVVSGLVALGVLVQAASVSFGWFEAISQVDKGLVIDAKYQGNAGHALHGIVGMYVMPLLGLILLIVAFFVAKAVPGARKWAGIVFGLILLQVALGMFAFGLPWLGALHGINALAVFATAGRASQLTRTGQGSGGLGGPPATPAQPEVLVADVTPCLTGSASVGGPSSRSSSRSSCWWPCSAVSAGTGRRPPCPRPTRSWEWGRSTSVAGRHTTAAPRSRRRPG